MPDLEISNLPALAGSALQATDPLPLADLSASETKKITVKDLVQHGVALIDDGSIPTSKFNYSLPPGSVGTTQLADDAVTAEKLADNSSAVVGGLPATGAFIGQLAMNASDGMSYIWDGGTWQAFKAAGSVNSVVGDITGEVLVDVTQLGSSVALDAKLAPSTAAAQFLAGPTVGTGPVVRRQIVGADVPAATDSTRGTVQVNGNGLVVDGAGVISIDNTVAAGVTYGVVTYNAQGLVTDGRPIESVDLPKAIAGAPGAVAPGSQFVVDPVTGDLSHVHTVTAGVATKVSFDATGHITAGVTLDATDIPALDASKITTGEFTTDRLADRSITRQLLADYAVSYIQEASPSTAGQHAGMLWLQESTGQLRMWNSNSWFPIGFGRLSAENLRYCGTFDATTGLITGITQFGTQAGYSIGQAVPTAKDTDTGVYFVCATPGNGTAVLPGVTFDAGDWVLCNGAAAGWVRIDTLNGGGGGGGATHLNDLLDVTVNAEVPGQVLVYDASNRWLNTSILDGGTY